jgi:hypothetical protein
VLARLNPVGRCREMEYGFYPSARACYETFHIVVSVLFSQFSGLVPSFSRLFRDLINCRTRFSAEALHLSLFFKYIFGAEQTWQLIRIRRLRIWPADTYSFVFVFVEYSFFMRLNELFETNMSTPVFVRIRIRRLRIFVGFIRLYSHYSRTYSECEYSYGCACIWPG